jgi:hypothetical protein
MSFVMTRDRAQELIVSSPRIYTPTGLVSPVDVQWANKLDWHEGYETFDPNAYTPKQWRHLMRIRARRWLEDGVDLPVKSMLFQAQLAVLVSGKGQTFLNKDIYAAADAGSSYVVPPEVTTLRSKAWGGGGGAGGTSIGVTPSGNGGGGGYAGADVNVTPGESLTKQVAGGGAGGQDDRGGGGGGGFTGLHRSGSYVLQAPGGGGGGGADNSTNDNGGDGGAGGGSSGVAGSAGLDQGGAGGGGGGNPGTSGTGGTGGSGNVNGGSGSANQGGVGANKSGTNLAPGGTNGGGDGGSNQSAIGGASGGGGGGGRFGGGGGGAPTPAAGGGGGGGGSGLAIGEDTVLTSGSGRNAGNNGDVDYAGNAGLGGASVTGANLDGNPGNPGRLVLIW